MEISQKQKEHLTRQKKHFSFSKGFQLSEVVSDFGVGLY